MSEEKKAENILFVCRQNLMRSRTAELVFGNTTRHQCRSAGLSKYAKVKINEELIEWADRIFVMEEEHKEIIHLAFPALASRKEIIILDIHDQYYFMEPLLVELLEEKVKPYL